jgi:multicomponent Na+:H+ antiporter subunit D
MEFGAAGLPLVAVILVSSLMAVVYVWRIVEAAWFGEDTGEKSRNVTVSPTLIVIAWLAALANLYFGLVPELPLSLSGAAATELLDHLP